MEKPSVRGRDFGIDALVQYYARHNIKVLLKMQKDRKKETRSDMRVFLDANAFPVV